MAVSFAGMVIGTLISLAFNSTKAASINVWIFTFPFCFTLFCPISVILFKEKFWILFSLSVISLSVLLGSIIAFAVYAVQESDNGAAVLAFSISFLFSGILIAIADERRKRIDKKLKKLNDAFRQHKDDE